MDYFTQKDREWFKKVKNKPEKYTIIIDNDCISVDECLNEGNGSECVHTFSSYGYEFIHALFNYLGVNCEYC